jgi:hypothetical protein
VRERGRPLVAQAQSRERNAVALYALLRIGRGWRDSAIQASCGSSRSVASRLDAFENAVLHNTRSLLLSARFFFVAAGPAQIRRLPAMRGTPNAPCAPAPTPTMLPGEPVAVKSSAFWAARCSLASGRRPSCASSPEFFHFGAVNSLRRSELDNLLFCVSLKTRAPWRSRRSSTSAW